MFNVIKSYIISFISFLSVAIYFYIKSLKSSLKNKTKQLNTAKENLKIKIKENEVNQVVNEFNEEVKVEKTKIEANEKILDEVDNQRNLKTTTQKEIKKETKNNDNDFVEVEI